MNRNAGQNAPENLPSPSPGTADKIYNGGSDAAEWSDDDRVGLTAAGRSKVRDVAHPPVMERSVERDGTRYRVVLVELPAGDIMLAAPAFAWSLGGFGPMPVDRRWFENALVRACPSVVDRRNLAQALTELHVDHFIARGGRP